MSNTDMRDLVVRENDGEPIHDSDEFKISPMISSLTGEVDPAKYPMRPADSEAAKKFREQLTPGEEAAWMLYWNAAKEAFTCLQAITAKVIEKIPDINGQIKIINKVFRAVERKFKKERQEADEQIATCLDTREPLVEEANKAQNEYEQAKNTLESREKIFGQLEKAKESLALNKFEGPIKFEVGLVWGIRAILGVALGLSLGLVIGALNQYKPFTPILWVFWLLGTVILSNSGPVISWLAFEAGDVSESKRHPGSTHPEGNKWIWLLVFSIILLASMEAAVLSFGAFRLLAVSSVSVPLPVMILVCFIFILPYLYNETRLGWREGVRKVRDHAIKVWIEREERANEITQDSLITERTKVTDLRVAYEQAKAKVDEVNTEIAKIDQSVKMPDLQSPIRFGPGVYAPGSQCANATWLSELIAPPLNEELGFARQKFLKAYEEATKYEEELLEKVKRKEVSAPEPRGFFKRVFSQA
jgi:hypothetical protein